jgi:hypothetical protein
MKRLVSTAAALSAALLMAIPAHAEGAGAVSITQTFQDATQTMPVAGLCSGGPGTATITYNAISHLTVLTSGVGAGTGWGTFTLAGSLTVLSANGVVYTGRITFWDGENLNLTNYTATTTFIVHVSGSDGSTFTAHLVAHTTVLLGPPPTVIVAFDVPTCSN